MAPGHTPPGPLWPGDLADVRERLARLEARGESHELANAERHRQLMDHLKSVEERLAEVERRSWRVALGLAVLGIGGGAGAAQLIRAALG